MTPADLQSFRRRMGWGHKECWRAFGVHQRTWYRWYSGKTPVPLWAREKVRDLLAAVDEIPQPERRDGP